MTTPQSGESFLSKIHEIAIGANHHTDDEIEKLLALGYAEFGFEGACVTSLESGMLTVLHSLDAERLAPGTAMEAPDAFCAEVVRRGHPLFIEDVEGGEWSDHPSCLKLGIKAYVGAPILFRGGLQGSVCFLDWDSKHQPLSSSERENLILLAQRIESVLERREVAGALEESETLFRATFELARAGIAHVGLNGDWIHVNPRICKIFGYPPEELTKLTFQDITYPEDLEPGLGLYQQALDGEIDHYTLQKRYLHKDGKIIWASLSARLVRSITNEPLYFIAVVEDITEQRQAAEMHRRFEDQVQEAQKLESLGLLAGGIAHDFNNLLTAILGNVSIAQDTAPSGSALSNQLQQIDKAARHAADLTNQLLAYAGKGAFVVQTVNLNDVVDDMQNLLSTALSKNANLVRSKPNKPMLTRADPTQVRQVIMNLMTNASEALDQQPGNITLNVERQTIGPDDPIDDRWAIPPTPGVYVALHVSDDGHGMDQETQNRLFEPFFTRKFVGRGLGLSAVLGIIRNHGGAIRVLSRPGEGTKVSVLFAADDDAQMPEASAASTTSSRPQSTGLALIVDDEASVRDVASKMTQHLGYKVVTAEDGRSAVDMVTKCQELRFVLLDLTMPGIGIEETVAEIHKQSPHLPIFLMSGYNEQDAMTTLAHPGLAGFLKKPFSLDSLAQCILPVTELASASA
jgi:two-component system cell cycle sensor histidine kinase/response regulator CckA